MKVFEMPVMTRISPATADRFALFVEALGAEAAAEVPLEAEGSGPVEVRMLGGASGSDLEREIRSNRF